MALWAEESFKWEIFAKLSLVVDGLGDLVGVERGAGDTLGQVADELESAIFAVFHASDSMTPLGDITLKYL